MKECSRCKIAKELTLFYTDNRAKDKKSSSCKVCISVNRNKEYQDTYREVNRESIKANKKAHYLKNKESIKKRVGKYKQSLKDSFYTIYYLSEEHYVGVTNQPKIRMQNHKINKNHVLDYEVITTVKTRREALDIESFLHKLNYNGKHPQTK